MLKKRLDIDIIAGARPNFMKIAPIIRAINSCQKSIINYRLIHTGQHYDFKMSQCFFDELNIPKPDHNLNVGSGSQASQAAGILIKYEELLKIHMPNYCMVVGDVTSTLAASIAAKKMGVKIIHVEAGIRSGDISMPEEINRIVTDSITDIFFTTSIEAGNNLLRSGVDKNKIYFVGNTMIDTLLHNINRLRKPKFWAAHNLQNQQYFLLTLHRPNNVDDFDAFATKLNQIVLASKGMPIVFPTHPRALKSLKSININLQNIILVDPLSYLEFIYTLKHSFAIITDSGGVSEEATVLNIPCLTLRETTERPETCEIGTNMLVGSDPVKIQHALNIVFSKKWKTGRIPDLWDGCSAERIVEVLSNLATSQES